MQATTRRQCRRQTRYLRSRGLCHALRYWKAWHCWGWGNGRSVRIWYQLWSSRHRLTRLRYKHSPSASGNYTNVSPTTHRSCPQLCLTFTSLYSDRWRGLGTCGMYNIKHISHHTSLWNALPHCTTSQNIVLNLNTPHFVAEDIISSCLRQRNRYVGCTRQLPRRSLGTRSCCPTCLWLMCGSAITATSTRLPWDSSNSSLRTLTTSGLSWAMSCRWVVSQDHICYHCYKPIGMHLSYVLLFICMNTTQ